MFEDKKEPQKEILNDVLELLKEGKYKFLYIANLFNIPIEVVKEIGESHGIKEPSATYHIIELLKKGVRNYNDIAKITCSSASNVRRVAMQSNLSVVSYKSIIIDLLKKYPNKSYKFIAEEINKKGAKFTPQNISKIAKETNLQRNTIHNCPKEEEITKVIKKAKENGSLMSIQEISQKANTSISHTNIIAKKLNYKCKKETRTQKAIRLYFDSTNKYSLTEIAQIVGCSLSLVSRRIKEEKIRRQLEQSNNSEYNT